jgi:hypothetical protein
MERYGGTRDTVEKGGDEREKESERERGREG